MNEFLTKLAERLQIAGADTVSADETTDWPTGKLYELVKTGVMKEIQHTKGVVCRECEENCFIEPDIRTNPDTGEATGVFVCIKNPDVGRIEVDLNRLKRWRIDKDKLKELGFLKKKVKRKKRKVSSELTPRETEVYSLIYGRGLTQRQAAIEMQCSPQYISKVLKKAVAKMAAQNSRSINFANAQKLPEDKRGQTNISKR